MALVKAFSKLLPCSSGVARSTRFVCKASFDDNYTCGSPASPSIPLTCFWTFCRSFFLGVLSFFEAVESCLQGERLLERKMKPKHQHPQHPWHPQHPA